MPAIPKKIGKYPVVEKLAEGGMGAVYKATHPTLERPVILKGLLLKGNPSFEERFRREARIMIDFRHEQIVQVYDHFQSGSTYYMVMEYVEGTDLAQLLKDRRYLPELIALLILREVCKALQYAHDHGVIHRDIKPGNILISKEGQIKLTDFGIAMSRQEGEMELTGTQMQLGTPAYMSPEQITAPKEVDHRADIYSLGVMLYLMMTGKKPFTGGFSPDVIHKVNKGQYLRPEKINPQISRFSRRMIKKLMHHKLKRRYRNLNDALHKLRKPLKRWERQASINQTIQYYLEGQETIGDRPPKESSSLKKTLRKWGFGLSTIGILGITLAGYGYWQGWHYEFGKPNTYGRIVFQLQLPQQERPVDQSYLKLSLFQHDEQGVTSLDSYRPPFLWNQLHTNKNSRPLLETKAHYLPTGTYQVRLDLDQIQHQQFFYLAPRTLQKQHPQWSNSQTIILDLQSDVPSVPLFLNYEVFHALTHQELSENSELAIFHQNRWMPWSEFQQTPEWMSAFSTGQDYSFRIKHPDFHTKYVNVSVPSSQPYLQLSIPLTPKSGTLSIDVPNPLMLQLNHLSYYPSVDEMLEFQSLPDKIQGSQQFSIPAGEYFVTLEKHREWKDWLLLKDPLIQTIPVQVHPNQTTQLSVDLDLEEWTLNIKTL